MTAAPRSARSPESCPILDDLFHSCALTAYVEQALLECSWPSPEPTRRRAYSYYEQSLASADRNRAA